MTIEHVRKILGDRALVAGSQQAAAVKLGVSTTYFSDVRCGRQEPGPKMLAALGMRRRVIYEWTMRRTA